MKSHLIELKEKIHPLLINHFLESLEEKIDLETIPKVECPICKSSNIMYLPFNYRKDAFCPNCYSLERHRFLYHYLFNILEIYSKDMKILHFAPEKAIYDLLNDKPSIDYYPVDLNENYPLKIRRVVDMCSICYEDNTFDMTLAVDVLEHIPDDRKAMKELYRVVKPAAEGGIVILMVPLYRDLKATFENEEYNTPELRRKYFGQEDHVRKYGLDIIDRLESVGFNVKEYRTTNVFNYEDIYKYGLKDVSIFICTKE